MKLNSRHLLLTVLLPAAAFGQGSLTPPGTPAPTMKTLDQIESRALIPGGTTAVTISQPGSYYLTGNLTVDSGDAITITAANVTLDLRGFTVATTATTPAGTAVKISGRRATVCNGNVAGTGTVSGATYTGGGFVNGVLWTGAIPQSITVRDVMVTGCSTTGIKATLVERCILQNVGTTGISGTIVRACQVDPCGGTGIYGSVVSDCVASAYTTGISGSSVSNSSGSCSGDSGNGLSCTTAQNCVGSSFGTGGTGLNVTSAVGCYGSSYNAVGLNATTATSSVGTSTNGVGMVVFEGAQCKGESTSVYGLVSDGTLIGCTGRNTDGSRAAIIGNIVIGCTYGAGPLSASYKYNMP